MQGRGLTDLFIRNDLCLSRTDFFPVFINLREKNEESNFLKNVVPVFGV